MTSDPSIDTVEGRRAVVDRVLLDRPNIHYMSSEDYQTGRPSGVWSTDADCYRLLADYSCVGSNTLETGCGVSTVLFAAWGSEHHCVTPFPEEADAVIAHCRERDISVDRIRFSIAASSEVLPKLGSGDRPLDVILLDGSHGFPAPMIDWYYSASHLRQGGIVVVDDLQLPAVRLLADYLDADARWLMIRSTGKWAAYERRSEGPLVEDWYLQPFYQLPGLRAHVARSLRRRLRRALRRIPFSPLIASPGTNDFHSPRSAPDS